MDYREIRQCLAQCRFTEHARKEMEEEPLGRITVAELLHALSVGKSSKSIQMIRRTPAC